MRAETCTASPPVAAGVARGPVVVEVPGDLDLHSASRLRTVLTDQYRAGQCLVIIDMSELDFMDSSGLGVLIGGLKRAQAAGGALVLAEVPDKVLRMLRITGVLRVMPVFERLADAFAHLDGAAR